MLILNPMSTGEYAAFEGDAIRSYAEENVRCGKWTADSALHESTRLHHELLPHGLDTKNHYLFSIVDQEIEGSVGILWFANIERAGKRIAYVYNLLVHPQYRRQGYAQKAFVLMEEKVKALELSEIALHVFGHNLAAYALYQKLGYIPTNINMSKLV